MKFLNINGDLAIATSGIKSIVIRKQLNIELYTIDIIMFDGCVNAYSYDLKYKEASDMFDKLLVALND